MITCNEGEERAIPSRIYGYPISKEIFRSNVVWGAQILNINGCKFFKPIYRFSLVTTNNIAWVLHTAQTSDSERYKVMSRTSAVEPAKRGACLAFLAASLDYMYLRQGATPPTTPALGEQASTAVTALFNRMIQQPPPEVSIERPEIKCTLAVFPQPTRCI